VRSRLLSTTLAAGAAGALLAACSADNLAERAVEMIDGVEGVDIDADSGSISIEGDDGERFEMDVDEDDESTTITTQDGTITTAADQELPSEIAAVFDPPPGYRIGAVSDLTDDGNRVIMTQGEIEGDWQELMDDLEARVRAGNWDDVQVSALAVGAMGGIVATRNDGEEGLNITLLMEENNPTGMMGVTYLLPAGG
jgi:hypothetical protein